MNAPADLTPKQQDFLERACAFIDSRPPRDEIEKLLTLAALQLPEAVVVMLKIRAASGPTGDGLGSRQLH